MWKITIALLFAFVLVSGALMLSMRTNQSSPPDPTAGIAPLRSYWNAEIRHDGPREAYAMFKRYYLASPSNSHTAAHVMGELFYRTLGLSGFIYCDASFSYGCYHEFIAEALVDHGPDAVQELAAVCDTYDSSQRGACIHGIGHGVLEYHGADHLLNALNMCQDLFDTDGAGACANGVFMDYNAPLTLDDAEPTVHQRPFDPLHPFSACDMEGIPIALRGSCYVSLAPYWWQSVGGITAVAALCDSAPKAYQDACYRGIGINLPGTVGYDEASVLLYCDRLVATGHVHTCLETSAQILEQFGKDACLIYSKLGTSVGHGCT